MEDPYTKREIDTYFKVQDTNFERLFSDIKNQNETLKRIESNQTETQGRILLIEDTIKEYSNYKKTVDSLVNYKWWVVGSAASFVVLGASVLMLYKANLDNQITSMVNNKVQDALNARFSKTQVILNNNN